MPLQTIDEKYINHGLQLIRYSNGLNAKLADEFDALTLTIRRILAGADTVSEMGRRNINALINEVLGEIDKVYVAVAAAQNEVAAELISLEAQWAQRTGRYPVAVSDTALQQARRNLTVMGNTIAEKWQQELATARTQIASEIRLGITAGQNNRQIAQRVTGVGKHGIGGVTERARGKAQGVVDATTHTAADAGRREAMRANGINALRWHAVLDTRTCPSCGERAGKLWDMDGKPIGHSIPYFPPVLHPWCRCLLTPMKFPKGPPADGGKEINKFADFLGKLTPAEQAQSLGKGRAELWREGKITTADLIGQDGLVLDLRELRAIVAGA